jgi:serine/threonine protein kinase
MSIVSMKQPGEIIQGRYQVEHIIGVGAFAEVYRGIDLTLNRDVAIKMMKLSMPNHNGFGDESMRHDMMARFLKEARLVARLRMESTVTLFDFGAEPGGDMFMVLEYVDGLTWRQQVNEYGAMDVDRVARVLRQALISLHEAHSYTLLHRDIKPENLMIFEYLGVPDQVRLVDFGIAKALQEDESAATAAGMLVGTPRYIPPERITLNKLYPASDLYSLGAVAYYLLVGEEIYQDVEGAMMILQQQIQPASITLPEDLDVPDELRLIVNRMLCKDLERRYAQAFEVIADIDTFMFMQANRRFNISQELPHIDESMIEPLVDPLEHSQVLTRAVVEAQQHDDEEEDDAPTQVVVVDPSMFD